MIKVIELSHSRFGLFFNGKKCHYGVFASIQGLRMFWSEHKPQIVSGLCQWHDHAASWQLSEGPNRGLKSDLEFTRWFQVGNKLV